VTSQQYDVSSDKRKTAKKYEIEYRQRQVAIMAAQGMTEIEIAAKVGVDNTTKIKFILLTSSIASTIIWPVTKYI
jgi:DNA-binding NarL/FixJ family response regulator